MTVRERPDAASSGTVPLQAGIGAAVPQPLAGGTVSPTKMVIFALAVVLLCAANMLHAYGLGFQSRMYDSPIYRWRESLVIALSRMQPQPLHGYVGYGSILNYLTQHGMALIGGEATPLPSPADLSALAADGPRLDRLMQEASRVPIDPKLPPVILQGNELGLVDYMYWAFELYGINVNALFLFYFTLLFASVVLFFITFRECRFCLLLLMLFLAGHYFALDYATSRPFLTIHNSRFLPVLALLPSLHLLLLLVTRARLSLVAVAIAAVQTFILMFALFCRIQGLWQVMAVILAVVPIIGLRPLRQALLRPRRWLAAILQTSAETWPALLAVLGTLALFTYTHVAPDPHLYSKESKEHLLWHSMYVSTVSSDPELIALYSYRLPPFSDSLGYFAALHDLRGRNDAASPIATVNDGVINVDIMKSNGAYDLVIRRLFFRVLREHPWLVLRSIVVEKTRTQFENFEVIPQLWKPANYVVPIALAAAATLLVLTLGAPALTAGAAWLAAGVLLAVVACSMITTLIDPSANIADVVLTWFVIALLVVVYLPIALLFYWLRPGGSRAGTGEITARTSFS